jgi:hypothetical protein
MTADPKRHDAIVAPAAVGTIGRQRLRPREVPSSHKQRVSDARDTAFPVATLGCNDSRNVAGPFIAGSPAGRRGETKSAA